ncbi:MAG: TonB-dependent receptor, partial [Alphaproteobacteria bacterium]|nr:TonB-dependent receptor [Alphaproteobacteria bacterium]
QQGYTLPAGTLNFGYRHKLSDSLILTATVADIFRSAGNDLVIAIPALTDHEAQRQIGRIFNLGLSWNFGGGRARGAAFDYSGG